MQYLYRHSLFDAMRLVLSKYLPGHVVANTQLVCQAELIPLPAVGLIFI